MYVIVKTILKLLKYLNTLRIGLLFILQEVTVKQVRKQLEELLQQDLKNYKEFIRTVIDTFL